MSRNVRISVCAAKNIYNIENDGTENGQCLMSGLGGYVFNVMIDSVRHYTNCTLNLESKIGDYNKSTGLYDGANGAIQRGESDMTATNIFYPLEDFESKYFEYSVPTTKGVMMFMSMYKFREEFVMQDVLDTIFGVGKHFVFHALGSFVVFSLIFHIGHWILNRNIFKPKKLLKIRFLQKLKRVKQVSGDETHSPIWLIFRAFLTEDNFSHSNTFHKLISVTVTIFLFFFTTYILNNMSTDLTIVKDPKAVKSYQETLDDPECQVLWATFLPDYTLYRDAPPGSIEAKLYERAVLVTSKEVANPIPVAMSAKEKLLKRKLVTVFRDTTSHAVMAIGAVFLAKYIENARSYRGLSVPTSTTYQNAILFSKKIDSVTKDILYRRIITMVEHGIYVHLHRNLPNAVSDEEGLITSINFSSSKIMKPDTPLMPIGLENIEMLLRMMAFIIVADIIVLISEIVIEKYWKTIFQRNRSRENFIMRNVNHR